jgi:hypothetical protein
VFCVRRDDDTAQLRILLVDPKARGLDIGSRLVGECIRFARRVGYGKMMLWTNECSRLLRPYLRGSRVGLVAEGPHHSFGHDLVEQTWDSSSPGPREAVPIRADRDGHILWSRLLQSLSYRFPTGPKLGLQSKLSAWLGSPVPPYLVTRGKRHSGRVSASPPASTPDVIIRLGASPCSTQETRAPKESNWVAAPVNHRRRGKHPAP